MTVQSKHFYAFGPFRFDSAKRVLVRDGTAVPLAPKATEILLVLVEQAGDLVEKDALIARVWPDAFVEEGNLNKNIFFLRKTLGEWESGRDYIETVPKRGYRFVAPVNEVTHGEGSPRPASTTAAGLVINEDGEVPGQSASEIRSDFEKMEQTERRSAARWRAILAGVVAVGIVAGASIWLTKSRVASSNHPLELKQRQLTTNSFENIVGGVISPDGKYLAYADRAGIHIKLIERDETQDIPQPDGLNYRLVVWEIVSWFPDGTRFVANSHAAGVDASEWTSLDSSVWVVSMLGGPPHKLRDQAIADSVSRDGSLISFDTNRGKLGDREIWLMEPDGQKARKLYDTNENSSILELNWSPDGQRTLYEEINDAGPRLVTRDLKGGPPKEILPIADAKRLNEFLWLPDGRLIYAMWETIRDEGTCNYWALRIDPRSGEPVGKPQRITNWAGFCVSGTSVTSDGKRLVFGEWRGHTSVYVADIQARGTRITAPTRLTLDDTYNEPVGWAGDGRTVIFFSSRNGKNEVFKQSLGQPTAERLIAAEGNEFSDEAACLNPEGSSVLYSVRSKKQDRPAQATLMLAPIEGGAPQFVLTANLDSQGPRCAKSPALLCAIAERRADRKQLVFTAFDPLKGEGRELAKLTTDAAADYRWDLSPDGTHIAILKNRENRIQVLSLNGGPPKQIPVKGWNILTRVFWTADGKGLFVGSLNQRGSVLLSVDLQGNARVLWEQTGGGGTYGVPSPDGRHLAMMGWTVNSNMWMLENF